MINAERLKHMNEGGVLLNFSRNGIIDDEAAVAALDSGRLYAYVCDFPSNLLKDHPRVDHAAAHRRLHPRGGGELRHHGRRRGP